MMTNGADSEFGDDVEKLVEFQRSLGSEYVVQNEKSKLPSTEIRLTRYRTED